MIDLTQRAALALALAAMSGGHAWAACIPSSGTATGSFTTQNGQIIGPDGQPFQGRGINVSADQLPDPSTVLSDFPGLNIVRLAVMDYNSPQSMASWVNAMTAKGIVVEIEDHHTSDGSDAGGGAGTIFTGGLLNQELSWYSSLASTFKDNPNVWFGTNNEPSNINPATGQADQAALSTWQRQTYDAIRNQGNNNPILLEVNGWQDPTSYGLGLTKSLYASMSNVVADVHIYGWSTGFSTDQAANNSFVNQTIADTSQAIQTANGAIPVFVGEYGDGAGPGPNGLAPNGQQVVNAVQASGASSTAWWWGYGGGDLTLQDGHGNLTAWGHTVAGFVAAGSAVGASCATSTTSPAPQPPTPGTPPPNTSAITTNLPSSPPSIDDVAKLASISSQDTNLPTPVQLANAILGNQPPQGIPGTYTPPTPPPTPSKSIQIAGYLTETMAPGTNTITISGKVNVASATDGPQNVTISGSGNAVRLGQYNDTITLTGTGNTVDGGGGEDTVVLNYPPTPAPAPQAAPTAPPTGNVLVAPLPGQGVLTVIGTLAPADRINVGKALAGTGWNGQLATVWNYMDALKDSTGTCVLEVQGRVVMRFLNGVPNDNIGPFIVVLD